MTPERWKQVSQIYDAVRSRPSSARPAYLAGMCAGDEELRREVQALLDEPTSPAAFEKLTPAMVAQAMGDVVTTDLTGRRFGAYVVHERIGAGGMGEVYRAHDTRLGRDVAIKVLPPTFANDGDRLARFEREARVLAALDHPNIATIYGVEEIDQSPDTGPRVKALVLALIEGDTLADRIAGGPLPSGEALEYARQIASALEAAHEKGIIHRDLKPANIKITAAGLVKVLDFGLAKTDGVSSSELAAVTMPVHATRTGMVLGTPAYMSPEQARGQEVDKRTDIWAFGCVLYEMLTGRAAFARDTASDTVAAILAGQIDWTFVPVVTPPSVQRLLRRCLVEAAHRLRDIGDARLEIDEALAVPPTTVNEDVHKPRSRWRDRVAWIAAAVFGVTAIGLGSVMWMRSTSAEAPGYRSELMMPPGFEAAGPPGRFAISPDGSRLAFTARNEAGTRLLWVRALNESAARSLAGTDGAEHPFWSPDSRTIAFYANAKLKKIAALGGAVFTVCDAGMFAQGGAWNRDDVILFNFGHGPLFRVSANGGTPTQATSLDREAQETGHAFPFFLPDGEHFLYLGYSLERTVAARGEFAGALYAGALGSPARTRVLDFISHAEYARGHILFVRDGALLSQSFDPDAMVTAGPPSVLVEQVNVLLPGSPVGAFSTSDDGVLAFEGPSLTIGSHLLWVDRQGREVGSLGRHARYAGNKVQLSPDGKRALVSRSNDGPFSHVVVIDTDSHLERRLTFAAEREGLPVWSPDGTRVALARGPSQALAVYIADSNGSGAEERLISDAYPASWSRDGRFLLYHVKEAGDLWVMPMIGARKPFPFLVTPVSKWDAQFSPDGRWVAYTSFESGRFEVFVSPFAETDSGRTAGAQPPNRWRVSSGGGDAPRWRTDGQEIFYWSREDTKLMAVPVKADGARFDVVGRAEPLFSTRPLQEANPLTFYDVSDDGQHFLINAFDAKSETPSLGLIVNWPQLLPN